MPQDADAVRLDSVEDLADQDAPELEGSGLDRLAARERAFGLLYEAEAKGVAPEALLSSLPVTPEAFAVHLVTGVATHLDAIDAELARVARRWEVDRMPALDRAVLRIGVFELGWTPEVPAPVVINEAVELAKRFSTDDSARFVNGVLSRLATDLR